MEINQLKDEYLVAARGIASESQKLGSREYSFFGFLTKRDIQAAKAKLDEHFEILARLDTEYENHTKIQSSINSVQVASARLVMLTSVRSIYVEAITNFEAEISRIEHSKNFALSMFVSMIAVLIAILGLALGQ